MVSHHPVGHGSGQNTCNYKDFCVTCKRKKEKKRQLQSFLSCKQKQKQWLLQSFLRYTQMEYPLEIRKP